MANDAEPMSWGTILVITLAAGVVSGMTLGFFGEMLGLSGGARTTGVGAVTGIVAALLVTRRRLALEAQKK